MFSPQRATNFVTLGIAGIAAAMLPDTLHTRSRRLLVSQLMQTNGYFIPNSDLMATTTQDAIGVTSVKVFRVRLVGAP